MKKYFPLIILFIGFIALFSISACNSQKKAAEKEAQLRKEKLEQGDTDKTKFEKSLPADVE
jgi:preprotein translocase subunit YajC